LDITSAPAPTCAAILNQSPIRKGSRPPGGIRTRYMDQVRRDHALVSPDKPLQELAQHREAFAARGRLFRSAPCPYQQRQDRRKQRLDSGVGSGVPRGLSALLQLGGEG